MSDELSNNPFYRKYEDSTRELGDDSVKTLAIFSVAHELAKLRQAVDDEKKSRNRMLKNIEKSLDSIFKSLGHLR